MDKIYKRFGKIMMNQIKQHNNKMKIKRLRKTVCFYYFVEIVCFLLFLQTFDTFKKSGFFDKERHSDEFLESQFQRALRRKGRFLISEDERKVSLSQDD